jgi:hypothetical protein
MADLTLNSCERLNTSQVTAIPLRAANKESKVTLAAEFKVPRATIYATLKT